MAYGDFKDLTRGTASGKILGDTVFNIFFSYIVQTEIDTLQKYSQFTTLLVEGSSETRLFRVSG